MSKSHEDDVFLSLDDDGESVKKNLKKPKSKSQTRKKKEIKENPHQCMTPAM